MSRYENSDLITFEFNRDGLIELLGLDDRQMIILSILCGNDIMKYEYKGNTDFVSVADMIKIEYPTELNDNEIKEKLFKNLSNCDNIPNNLSEELIQKSFNFDLNNQNENHLLSISVLRTCRILRSNSSTL
jgi:hypothetical protein